MDRIRLVGQTTQWPRLKKMYLILVLSTVCIFFFQFHISRAQLDSVAPEAALDQVAPHHQEPMRELLLAESSGVIQSTASGVDESENELHVRPKQQQHVGLPPPLYIITPTFRRGEQLAELTRLGYTLKHLSRIFWLVIEDSPTHTEAVTKLLNRIGVPFTHLLAPMPSKYRRNKVKPRGVSNRNRGLEWIRANATEGVIFFADDDNSYDVLIFEQMRYTRKIAMFPVGLVTNYGVSSPVVRNGTIVGFYDGWVGGRKFPVDMAGFAVSVKFFLSRPKAKMPYTPGYEEDGFLKSLAPFDLKDVELLASNCTEILVWHTQTKKNPAAAKVNATKYGDTNIMALRQILV